MGAARTAGMLSLVVGLSACAPALIRQGNRAVKEGDWVLAHDRYAAAAGQWPERDAYAGLAEKARERAARQLLEAAAKAADEGRFDNALELVDDALKRASPDEVPGAFSQAAESLEGAAARTLAQGDFAGAYALVGSVNARFPGTLDPKVVFGQIRDALAAASTRLVAAGQAGDAVALWAIVDQFEPTRADTTGASRLAAATEGARVMIAADRLEDALGLFALVDRADPGRGAATAKARLAARQAAGTRGLDNAAAAFRAGRRDDGLSWFDRAKAVAGDPKGFGTSDSLPKLMIDAGRAELAQEGVPAGLAWVAGLDRRIPGAAGLETLRKEARAAVEPGVRALVDKDAFEAAIALTRDAAAQDPSQAAVYSGLEAKARDLALDRLVGLARGAWGQRDLPGALASLDRAVALNKAGRALVSSRDPLPRELAAAGEDVLRRDGLEAGYGVAGHLAAAFPDHAAVAGLVGACREGLRREARDRYFVGQVDEADALFAMARRVDPAASNLVPGWQRDARAFATLDALAQVGRSVATGDPMGGIGWVDLARRIGGDSPEVRLAWGGAVAALVSGAGWLAQERGPVAGYEFLDDLRERFPGEPGLAFGAAQVRAGAYGRSEDLLRRRRYDEAIGILDVVRRYEPDRGPEVDRKRRDIEVRWALDLQQDASLAERRGEEGVAFVLAAQAARVGGRPVDDEIRAEHLEELLDARGARVGLSLTGAWRGTRAEKAFLDGVGTGPGLRWVPNDGRDRFTGRLDLTQGCETVKGADEPAVYKYLGAAVTHPNPARPGLEQLAKEADAAAASAIAAATAATATAAEVTRSKDAAVRARSAALADLGRADEAWSERRREIDEAVVKVTVAEAAAARVAAGEGAAAAARPAAATAADDARGAASAAKAALESAGAAWRTLAPTCESGMADAGKCRDARSAWWAARLANQASQRDALVAKAVLERLDEVLAGTGDDGTVSGTLDERRRLLESAEAKGAPAKTAVAMAERATVAAEEAAIGTGAAAAEARGAEADAKRASELASRRAAEMRAARDAAPLTVTERPELSFAYNIQHLERVCWTDVRFVSVLAPSGAPSPGAWREERRAESTAVTGNSSVGLPAKAPEFGPDEARLRESDEAVAAKLAPWLGREIGALRDQRIGRGARATTLDAATSDWLVGWWIDPRNVPQGLDGFLAASWPGVDRAAVAPRE